MNSDDLKTFFDAAERHITSVRSNLLLVAQNGDESGELAVAARSLRQLKEEVENVGLVEVAATIGDCETAIDTIFTGSNDVATGSYKALDFVSQIEANLLQMPLGGGDLTDIDEFVDAGFDNIAPLKSPKPAKWLAEEFEVDEETLEIFREEAEGLLQRIEADLVLLKKTSNDQAALWDIRRNAHTFKGAAGIVGLHEASATAHGMEDLLDKLVERQIDAGPNTIGLLTDASAHLTALVSGKTNGNGATSLTEHLAKAVSSISEGRPDVEYVSQNERVQSASAKPAATPIVRVSLDRLDSLIDLAKNIAENRRELERLLEVSKDVDPGILKLIGRSRDLTLSLTEKLRSVRMQRIATLETRLRRAINVTCEDEGKFANLTVENGDTEIDTLLIDGLVEPLLHLLKNSVVHGIESPDTRRLIGKDEIGEIVVSVRRDGGSVMLSIADDGRGISVNSLTNKAVKQGLITAEAAALLEDEEALELIFHPGLTTADTLNLNAGRGIGMAIVKESIESLGGRVGVASELQKGTRFILTLPLGTAAEAEDRKLQANAPSPLQPTVLIVDDSASIRRHTAKLVENAGCRVLTAIDGAEAIEILLSGNWRPDLVLSDVEMPRMDGWELLQTIKESYELNTLPVVLITSLDADEYRSRAFDLGAADYVVKPLTSEHLTTNLSKFISGVGLAVSQPYSAVLVDPSQVNS